MILITRFIRNYQRDKHYQVMRISVFFLLWALAFALFEFFVPLYLESLELSFFTIGLILSGSSFISFFIDPFLGHIQTRFPPKTLLLISIILFCANILLFKNSGNAVFLLFLATNIYGIAFDLFSITSYKNVFDNSIETDRSTHISLLESLYSVGLLVGAVVAGFIVSLNLSSIPYLCLGILLFLFIFILSWKAEKKVLSKEKISFTKSYTDIFYEFKMIGSQGLFLVFLLIFIHLFDGFFFVFEPIFARKFQGYFFDEFVIGGLLLAIYTLPMIMLERNFGTWEDRLGRKKFVFIGLAMSTLSIFLLQSFDQLVISALLIFMTSLGLFAIALPAVEGMYESLTERKLGKQYRGYTVSIMEITLSIGFLLGPFMGGIFLTMPGGFNAAFKIFSLLNLFVLVLALFFLREDISKDKERGNIIPKSTRDLL